MMLDMDLTRPIIGIESRTAHEVFEIMADRIRSALSCPIEGGTEKGEPVELTYTNWRGETAVRKIKPVSVWFGSTDWHPEPQWLLRAIDVEKQAERDFALKDFGTPSAEIEALRVEKTSNIIAAFERDYPELYWHVAKGKVCAGEPLYGAIITLQGGDEIGHGESELSAEDAFRIAFVNSGLPTPPSYRSPSKAEISQAIDTIYRANGSDLDQWTAGALPSDDIAEARAALQQQEEGK